MNRKTLHLDWENLCDESKAKHCNRSLFFQSLVQIETMGEFGVFFILFSVGLEFTPDKIKKA